MATTTRANNSIEIGDVEVRSLGGPNTQLGIRISGYESSSMILSRSSCQKIMDWSPSKGKLELGNFEKSKMMHTIEGLAAGYVKITSAYSEVFVFNGPNFTHFCELLEIFRD